jgi:hypothetical protein
MKAILLAGAALVLTTAAHANAHLPEVVRGDWHHTAPINDGSGDVPVPATIGADRFHEPGYNCQVKNVHQQIDPNDRLPLYAVDMRCAGELEHPYPLKTFWALRKTSAGEVLVITALQVREIGCPIEVLEKGRE